MNATFKRTVKLIGLAMLLPMLVTGCQTTRTIPITGITAAIPCRDLKPILYSAREDSRFTADQVRQFNAAYDAVCKR